MAPVIRAENLGKRYHIGAGGARAEGGTLYAKLSAWAGGPLRRLRGEPAPSRTEEFWALRDVSFEVPEGDVVGIVGRNGAGKSTLLKLLSRVTRPSSGRARLRGRVGTLLEVGTGFHPELTGRENVFLSGALLGMSRRDIRRRFDEIVAFSELEKFLDTPVKRYSSGMYVRLGFAVAAHLENEILIVDEVLAVGDARFQKRCLGKINDVARGGRTILLVSHSSSAVRSMCRRALLLRGGRLVADGTPSEVMQEYLSEGSRGSAVERLWEAASAPANEGLRLRRVAVCTGGGLTAERQVEPGEPCWCEIDVEVVAGGFRPGVTLVLGTADGNHVLSSISDARPSAVPVAAAGTALRYRCPLPTEVLAPGDYLVTVFLWLDQFTAAVAVPDAVGFRMDEDIELRGEYHGHWAGAIRPRLAWEVAPLDTPVSPPFANGGLPAAK